jgi:hypothetical protein
VDQAPRPLARCQPGLRHVAEPEHFWAPDVGDPPARASYNAFGQARGCFTGVDRLNLQIGGKQKYGQLV